MGVCYQKKKSGFLWCQKLKLSVSHYKYLGIHFSSRLKWNLCCTNLAQHAVKALNVIKKCLIKYGIRNCKAGFKLFDSMIAPILYYGSELYGA
ncbi:hypothetical protein SNE40_004037 [Patella caerulea]|uniref:Uncharacterized protein n=1 Tax=Patella caerulea TaxID=87958 RepID=A0AAN8K453_PATCE